MSTDAPPQKDNEIKSNKKTKEKKFGFEFSLFGLSLESGLSSLLTLILLLTAPYVTIFSPETVKKIPGGTWIIQSLPIATVRFHENDYPYKTEDAKRVATILYSGNTKDSNSAKLALESMSNILYKRIDELPNDPSCDATTLGLKHDLESMRDGVISQIDTFKEYPTDIQGVTDMLQRFDNVITRSDDHRTQN